MKLKVQFKHKSNKNISQSHQGVLQKVKQKLFKISNKHKLIVIALEQNKKKPKWHFIKIICNKWLLRKNLQHEIKAWQSYVINKNKITNKII